MTTTPTATPSAELPAKRSYAAPALVTHGDVRSLTLGKTGEAPDLDSAGSFTAGLADDASSDS